MHHTAPVPRYAMAHSVTTHADLSAPTDELWRIHDRAHFTSRDTSAVLSPSLLDVKIELAGRIHRHCHFCERRCRTDRTTTPGFCGVQDSKYSSEFLHYGEEDELVPSHTIFFTGCTFKCAFCQNRDIARHPLAGLNADPDRLAWRIYERAQEGSRNVNWVGGDPTPHVLTILKTLRALADLSHTNDVDVRFLHTPAVFNSNAYYSSETMRLLDGAIDTYLSDFKYGNNACARRYSLVEAYVETVTRNLTDSRDRLIIRHLVMPGHVNCCTRPIVKWVCETMPEVRFNLMFQYTPYNVAEYPEINRYLNNAERRDALRAAKGLNLI
ncbi:MAG: radical SAM protein [Halobacteriota archaeon]